MKSSGNQGNDMAETPHDGRLATDSGKSLIVHPVHTLDDGDSIRFQASVEIPGTGSAKSLWYSVPRAWATDVCDNLDPFAVGLIMWAMARGRNLSFRGRLSRSLLENLSAFQRWWHLWLPEKFTIIRIDAAEAVDDTFLKADDAICAFSGGVDSCFTALQQHFDSSSGLGRRLKAALMVHGFDIPLEEQEVFHRAFERARRITESVGLELIPLKTNLRKDFTDSWNMWHGACTAAVLILFQKRFATGVISSAGNVLVLPWGSNPITDPLCSNRCFQMIHFDAAYSRLDKIRSVARWQTCCQLLRVCWEGREGDRNCGKCEKCVRTILEFKVLGLELPDCFDKDPTLMQIARMSVSNPVALNDWKDVDAVARSRKIRELWSVAVRAAILRNQIRIVGRRIAQAVRGSRQISW